MGLGFGPAEYPDENLGCVIEPTRVGEWARLWRIGGTGVSGYDEWSLGLPVLIVKDQTI